MNIANDTKRLAIDVLRTPWSVLLIATIIGLVGFQGEASGTAQNITKFIVCGVGLVPLAKLLSVVVEKLADKLGDRVGGLISVILGNLVEIVVSITALTSGLYYLVITSTVGAVLTNSLLMLGLSTFVAGRKELEVSINSVSSFFQSRMLMLGTIIIAVPTIIHNSSPFATEGTKVNIDVIGSSDLDAFAIYSLIIAVLTIFLYAASFFFQMGTNKVLFDNDSEKIEDNQDTNVRVKSYGIGSLLIVLAVISVLLVMISEPLVDSLQIVANSSGISVMFVGLFLLPLFGSISEGLVSFNAASKGRINLAITSTVESSSQLLLFVLPVLIIIGWFNGHYLHATVHPASLGFLITTVIVLQNIVSNDKLDWYEGLMLITLYLIFVAGSLFIGG